MLFEISLKRDMNFLYFIVGVLAILGETVKTVECFSTPTIASATKCNGSTIGDCIPVNEEFLMESEISIRILDQKSNGVSYQTFMKTKSFCDANAYGSCMGNMNTNFKNRPCNSPNLCGRTAT
ncbi:unnamed protein product [Fraxinus pennsylvanica]|uniref:Uncharacterized protein n=1 Tax=Fraxinus pennsylvanica TaxID=56036 RepID=A0AAD2E903_9LAMI|nr:unnamed protein product [Fraxinus pennsylvanica]